jgi:hypothetical protein
MTAMTDGAPTVRRPMQRAVHAIVAAGLVCAFTPRAQAQWIAPPPADAPATAQFMSRYDFHLSADATASGDERFSFDTHFGGDMDLVDYKHGRGTILIDYQAVLGDQLRPFDPNQGNYLLEASSSGRIGTTEIAGVFHHESRHLGDRLKIPAIAWNTLQLRVLQRVRVAGTVIDLRGDAGKIVQYALVDYDWTADIDARMTRPFNSGTAVYARAYAETFGIRHDVSPRGRQTGGRAEAGVRLIGRAGVIELFAGYERVVDADALQALPLSWAFGGFRLVNK